MGDICKSDKFFSSLRNSFFYMLYPRPKIYKLALILFDRP